MKAVIFDMDGVLVDSEIHWQALESDHIRKMVPEWKNRDYEQIVGCSVNDLFKYIVTNFSTPLVFEEFLIKHLSLAKYIYMEKVSLIQGVIKILQSLKSRDIDIGLASSSPMEWIDMVMDRFSLREYFKVIVSAEHLDGKGKPSPEIYMHTAKLMNYKTSECIAVEDSKNGVLSAVNSGMYCVGFRNGFNDNQDLSKANIVVLKLLDIDFENLLMKQ